MEKGNTSFNRPLEWRETVLRCSRDFPWSPATADDKLRAAAEGGGVGVQ